jgi:hypothetical protein
MFDSREFANLIEKAERARTPSTSDLIPVEGHLCSQFEGGIKSRVRIGLEEVDSLFQLSYLGVHGSSEEGRALLFWSVEIVLGHSTSYDPPQLGRQGEADYTHATI